MTQKSNMILLPTVILRNNTVFPKVTTHLDVGRETTISALEEALTSEIPVFLVNQKQYEVDIVDENALYPIGTIAYVKQMICMPEDNMRVLVEGFSRGKLVEIQSHIPYIQCQVEMLDDDDIKVEKKKPKEELLIRNTLKEFEHYIHETSSNEIDVFQMVEHSKDMGFIADRIAEALDIRNVDKQRVLQELQPLPRLRELYSILKEEVELYKLHLSIDEQTQVRLSENQRDYYLRERLKVIQQELGEGEQQEIQEYYKKVEVLSLPTDVEDKLKKEIKKLSRQSFSNSESAVQRNYIDACLEVPWNVSKPAKVDVGVAKKQLDKDHFGLDNVKERILEYLAVRELSPNLKGQVLCLVGPPGVGKTSVAKSVAKAMGREFIRISLGGLSDESEIRGHRKTYIGAMPGRIMVAVTKAKCNNPVILLDELDKLGKDHRGDPSAALLEVLDWEQNGNFRDHYLELPFDLSKVFFMVTANSLSTIQRPLLDRMDIIEIPSYTDEEKLQIGKKYLFPSALQQHGLLKKQVKITDVALREVISGYTRESGVRNFQRQLSTICRKSALRLVTEDVASVQVSDKNIERFLGVKRYHNQTYSLQKRVGIVNGLAWTSVGGELLEVEVNVVPGSGKIILTGNLGDVMKESAQTALSLIRYRGKKLKIPANFHEKYDTHIHFPEGGIPKDGPSAGIAITTAIVSAITNREVRPYVAMTGEVSLRGRVLAIGGLREKSMAALRNGVKLVLIPKENEKDLEEIDQTVRNKLEFLSVETIDQVLDAVIFYE